MTLKVSLISVIIIILTALLLAYSSIFFLLYLNVIPINIVPIENFCISDNDCVLSLCDCRCHNPGQTPEEIRNIVCGKNCAAWYNVSGCKCSSFECVEITT